MMSLQEFTDASPPSSGKTVVLFVADWHPACGKDGPMDQLLTALATTSSTTTDSITFGRCNAEENPSLTEKYRVESVPTFVYLQKQANEQVVVERVNGENAAAVTTSVQRLANSTEGKTTSEQPKETTLTQRLDRLIRSAEVVVFIKGVPTQPRCGFSRQIVEILQDNQIPFASLDIFSDEEVRQGLKKHSNWPTYPQLYVNGELIGGLDIVKEMLEDKTTPLAEQLGVTQTMKPEESLDDRLRNLIRRSPVMLFMKGLPSQPRCGFSKSIVEILDSHQVSFDAFDILSDEQVRQGLKKLSNWPTYPQLYIDGGLIGGLDIVREMEEDGSLKEALDAVSKK